MTRFVIKSGRVGFTEDVDLLGRARAALGVADDPAHGVAGGDRPRADELLAFLQGDVGDLAGRCIGLIERARRIGIDLDGVDEPVADRLDASGRIGLVDARRWDRRHPGRRLARIERLQLAGQRQGLRQFDDLDRARGIDSELRRHGAVVVDIRRDEVVRAAPERGDGHQQSRKAGFTERRIPSLPALLRN